MFLRWQRCASSVAHRSAWAEADGAIAGVTQAAAFCEVRAWAEDQRIVRRELQLDVVGGNDQAIRATIMPSKNP